MPMKKYFCLSFLMAGNLLLASVIIAQNKTTRISTDTTQTTIKTAIQKLKAFKKPSWCTTPALQNTRKIIIEKCIQTLYHNYLKANAAIFHDGVVPSPTTFDGLWAWDSWKHAYALAYFDKELAENSVRAMYDYQDAAGMIADCIFTDTGRNNYRDTKPPLSAWAVYKIYQQTKDTNFLREMFPKLLKYHYWWYINRDHDQNGLCEYGSTDNTLEAARWESGWDNAVRFDQALSLKNSEHAYSMNVESVDLNSYLFLEKNQLAKIALLLGKDEIAVKLKKETGKLTQQIQSLFYDSATSFFYDIQLEDKNFIMSKEASGWLPLYAGIATREQAEKVKNTMLNENYFNTFIPLPTLSKDNLKFDPAKGYWRGPVWLDQFYFGYKGLKNYGYTKEADGLLVKLLQHAEQITKADGALRENYNPINGKGQGAKDFGWSAALLLMMMLDE